MVKSLSQTPNLDDIASFTVSGNAGDFVYKEGDAGKDMFIIQEGKVELVKAQAGETVKPVALGAGDFFGELSLFEEQPRDSTARGLTPYRLLRIDRTTLGQLVQENPEIAVRMLYRLASRLREHEDALRRASEIAASFMKPLPPMQQVSTPAVGASGVRAPTPPAPAAPAPPPPPAAKAVESPNEATRARRGSSTPQIARLVHSASGTEFRLTDLNVIGRFDRASGYTPEVDLTPLDAKRTLSRRHASITRQADGWYLSEPKPTGNGTFVNDARVAAGVSVKLSDGDRVRFGVVETVFTSSGA